MNGDRPIEDGRSRPSAVTPGRVLWGVLALVAVVLLLQNSQDTTVQFLGWDITAPLFVVIGASLVIGWGLGELGTRTWRWHRGRQDKDRPAA